MVEATRRIAPTRGQAMVGSGSGRARPEVRARSGLASSWAGWLLGVLVPLSCVTVVPGRPEAAPETGAVALPSDASTALEARAPTPATPPDAGPASDPEAALTPPPSLSWRVTDDATGESIPAKLTVIGVEGTADPTLDASALDLARPDDGYAAHDRIFTLSGAGGVTLPAGTYEVWVTRGVEWSHHAERVVIGAEPVRVDARLSHVIDTEGWLSADLHVHATPSHDSNVPLPVRVMQFISEGVEMIVATDHNVITDYEPTIEQLEVTDLLASAAGCEVTTPTFGHFGSYPLVRDASRGDGGAPAVDGVLPEALFDSIRAASPRATIAVNHPTWGDRDYFNRAGLDAATATAAWKDFSWKFDAIEVLNGFHDPQRGLLDRNLGEFFALIEHGYIKTATGNSDTHSLRLNIGGYPRNYLRISRDDPAEMTPELLGEGIRKGRSFFTTGPFVRLRVEGGDIGDTVQANHGWVSVDIEVNATTWVSAQTVTLFVGGRIDRIWRLPPKRARATFGFAGPLRWTARRVVPIDQDTHVTLLVEGDESLWPVVGERDEHVVTALAFTNPVWVDADGNGRYDAPLAPRDSE
ncbi:MAG: PHP domain-containing protein [Deltaproteobacteria bacterium]|nr:PHP domain-containing protein [Deltaproteobacteria bacterium]MCB9786661.1 PHP domain-containing protein [Deltaproteobacteria bacterium]